MRDPYVYPDSEVLKNLADIRDAQRLRDMESDYVVCRLSEIVTEDSESRYDFEALCEMHRRIFQDVYEWAGRPRVINIEKAEVVLGELSIEYSDCFDIVDDASHVLTDMQKYCWKDASFDEIVIAFADYLAQLWKVHPFREGNTRTVVIFCSMFLETQGIYIESDLFKDNASYLRSALVAASAIFSDLGDLRKPEYLYRIVQDALEQGKQMREQVKEKLQNAGIEPTEKNIRKMIFWERKDEQEHSIEEIWKFLM